MTLKMEQKSGNVHPGTTLFFDKILSFDVPPQHGSSKLFQASTSEYVSASRKEFHFIAIPPNTPQREREMISIRRSAEKADFKLVSRLIRSIALLWA